MVRHGVITSLFFVLLVACGSDEPSRDSQSQFPRFRAPSNPPKEPLEELSGYYDLVSLNGEEKLAGYVAVVFDETRAGFTVDPYLTADNPAPRVRWMSVRDETKIEFRERAITQRWVSGENKLEITFERQEKTLLITGERCSPQICVPVHCVAKKPD